MAKEKNKNSENRVPGTWRSENKKQNLEGKISESNPQSKTWNYSGKYAEIKEMDSGSMTELWDRPEYIKEYFNDHGDVIMALINNTPAYVARTKNNTELVNFNGQEEPEYKEIKQLLAPDEGKLCYIARTFDNKEIVNFDGKEFPKHHSIVWVDQNCMLAGKLCYIAGTEDKKEVVVHDGVEGPAYKEIRLAEHNGYQYFDICEFEGKPVYLALKDKDGNYILNFAGKNLKLPNPEGWGF